MIMGGTGMKVNTHFFNTVTLEDVKELLPPDHHIRKLDDTIVVGLQKAGDYFVTTVNFFSGKKKRANTCISRLTLYEVLEDGSTDDRSLECFMYGSFCEELEQNLRKDPETQGVWSADMNGQDTVVWVVLHRPMIQLYRGARKGLHPLSIIVGPDTSPHCEMWILVGKPPKEATPSSQSISEASTPSPSLIDITTPPSLPPLPTTPPSTTITSDTQPSTSRIPTSSTQASLAYSTPTSSTHPSPPNLHSRAQATTTTSAPTKALPPAATQPSSSAKFSASAQYLTSAKSPTLDKTPAPAQPSTSAQSSAPTRVQPVQGKSPPKVKQSLETRNSSQSRPSAPTKTQTQAKSPTRAKPLITPRSSVPARPHASAPSRSSQNIRIQYKLKPLSKAVPGCKMSTAGVVVEVVKEGHISTNNTTYDIIKIADKGLTDPTSSQNHFMIKVFHNDKVDWPEDGKPVKGQVMVLKDLVVKEFKGAMEGIVYTTKMACICTCDEDNQLTWYSHSLKCPYNIENAEKVALDLFEWWRKDGCAFQFGQHSAQLPSRSAAALPACTISQAGGKGLFILYCQVLKKTLYPALINPKGVLRVCDGTRTSYQFEEIISNPTSVVQDSQRVYGDVGSLEVDILMTSNIIPPEVENLQDGSFVRLRGVDCHPLPGGCRKLTFFIGDDDEYLKVLEDDAPQVQPLKNAVQQARAEEEEAAARSDDDGFSVDSEEMDGGTGLMVRESPAPSRTSVSPLPELPNDSFENFVREQEWLKRGPPGNDLPSNKRRRLNFNASECSSHSSFTSYRRSLCTPTLQSYTTKSSHPSPQPHASKHVPSPQPHTSRQSIHPSSPQPSTSKLPLHPSSHQPSTSKPPPHPFSHQPSTSKQSLHPSSPQPSTSKPSLQPSSPKSPNARQPQQHSSPQAPTHSSCSPISTHYSALEELQQHKTTKNRSSLSTNKPLPNNQTHRGQARPTRQLQFHTEVVGEAKEMNLETFFIDGEVREMYRVEATITDIRVITPREYLWCGDADHLCLHQWVWGLCQKCGTSFSSSQLYKYFSPLALNSLNFLQCKNCIHKHRIHANDEEDGGQPLAGSGERQLKEAVSHHLSATVSPFIKIKVEVEDPTSGFQLISWLTTDNANLFFGVTPTFRWVVKVVEVQEVVEALLAQNCSLVLGMMKKEVQGRVDMHIVNTVLHTTSSHSKTVPGNLPHHQPSPASHPQHQSLPTGTSHPPSPSTSPSHPQSPPTILSHPQSPLVSPLHQHQSPTASPPHPQQHHTESPKSLSSKYRKSRSSHVSGTKGHSSPTTPTHSNKVQTPHSQSESQCSTPPQQNIDCLPSQCCTTPPNTQFHSPQSQSQCFVTPPQPESPQTSDKIFTCPQN